MKLRAGSLKRQTKWTNLHPNSSRKRGTRSIKSEMKKRNKFREKHQHCLKLGTGQNILLNNYYEIFLKFFLFI